MKNDTLESVACHGNYTLNASRNRSFILFNHAILSFRQEPGYSSGVVANAVLVLLLILAQIGRVDGPQSTDQRVTEYHFRCTDLFRLKKGRQYLFNKNLEHSMDWKMFSRTYPTSEWGLTVETGHPDEPGPIAYLQRLEGTTVIRFRTLTLDAPKAEFVRKRLEVEKEKKAQLTPIDLALLDASTDFHIFDLFPDDAKFLLTSLEISPDWRSLLSGMYVFFRSEYAVILSRNLNSMSVCIPVLADHGRFTRKIPGEVIRNSSFEFLVRVSQLQVMRCEGFLAN